MLEILFFLQFCAYTRYRCSWNKRLKEKGTRFTENCCTFGVRHARCDTLLLNSLQEWIPVGFSNLPDSLVYSPSIYREVKAVDAKRIDQRKLAISIEISYFSDNILHRLFFSPTFSSSSLENSYIFKIEEKKYIYIYIKTRNFFQLPDHSNFSLQFLRIYKSKFHQDES